MRTRTAAELAAIHFDAEQRMFDARISYETADDHPLEERRRRYMALAEARAAEGEARRRLERKINGESSVTDGWDLLPDDGEEAKEAADHD